MNDGATTVNDIIQTDETALVVIPATALPTILAADKDDILGKLAAKRERDAADALARAEREKTEAEERAKEAEAKAERDRLAAEQKAERDRAAAVEAERRRIEAAAEAQRHADELRAANTAHRAGINRKVLAAIMLAMSEVHTGNAEEADAIGKAIVTAIAKGAVPHTTINY